MVAGFVPVIGEIADIILIIRYLTKREYLYAAIMLIALIPTVGDIIAKPFIRVLKATGGVGRAALKNADEMAAFLAKNPELKKQYMKMGKYFDHPSVKKTVESISKVNSTWGRKMGESLSEAKSVLGKMRPVQMVKRVGREVAKGGKVSKGLKSFFQEEKLAQYIAKTGTKPTTWLSNWWNVVRTSNIFENFCDRSTDTDFSGMLCMWCILSPPNLNGKSYLFRMYLIQERFWQTIWGKKFHA